MTDFSSLMRKSIGKVIILLLILPLLWLLSGFYSVDQNEIAIPVILGTVHQYRSAGIHYNAPVPLGEVFIADIKKSDTVSVGFKALDYDGRNSIDLDGTIIMYTGNSKETVFMDSHIFDQQFMTGDGNILSLEMDVIFNISDPRQWFFNYSDPLQLIHSFAQDILFKKLSTESVDTILVRDPFMENDIRESLQVKMDSIECGVHISSVIFKNIGLPVKNVETAFRDVKSAEDDRTKRIEDAKKEASLIITQGKTEALKIKDSALIKATEITNKALTDYEIFNKMNQSREVENQFDYRLYRETIDKVLHTGKIYLISPDDSLESLYIDGKGD